MKQQTETHEHIGKSAQKKAKYSRARIFGKVGMPAADGVLGWEIPPTLVFYMLG